MSNVNHPKHYNEHPSGIECITIARHYNFNIGNVFKYIWRAGLKGDEIEDLEKAAFYLQDEIERIKKYGNDRYTTRRAGAKSKARIQRRVRKTNSRTRSKK